MTDHSSGQRPAVVGESSTAGRHDLSHVVDMVARVEALHGAGYSPLMIATILEAEEVEHPTGGGWDRAAVEEVLRVVEQLRHDAPQLADQSLPAPVGVETPAPAPTPDPTSAPARAPAPTPALTPTPAPADPGASVAPADPLVQGRGPSWARGRMRAWVGLGAVVVVVLAVGNGALWLANRDVATGVDGLGADPTSADGAVDPAGEGTDALDDTIPFVPAAPSVEDADPADMMAIRIEPAQDAAAGGDGTAVAATATIRSDGLLYFEGAFRSQAEADDHVARAASVFGAESIVEDYVVDPDAPAPAAANVTLDKPVLFEHGSAAIDPEFIPFLVACGDVLRLNPSITMSIAAYTDSTGDRAFNLELSQRRAQAIVDFYRDLDIGDGQLSGVGLGEAAPVADNSTDAGRAANRRAMLMLNGCDGRPGRVMDLLLAQLEEKLLMVHSGMYHFSY